MKELLDRPLTINNLVLFMCKYSQTSNKMMYGLVQGKSIFAGVERPHINPKNVYLIERPTDKEFEIRDELLVEYEEYRKEWKRAW